MATLTMLSKDPFKWTVDGSPHAFSIFSGRAYLPSFLDVASFLDSLDMGAYKKNFKQQEITGTRENRPESPSMAPSAHSALPRRRSHGTRRGRSPCPEDVQPG